MYITQPEEVHGKFPEGCPRTDESRGELMRGRRSVFKAMRKMDEDRGL